MPRRPILILTRIWPTPGRPSLGSFVRARASGVAGLRVVRPRWPSAPRITIYPVLLFDALAAGRRIRGVEAHMLFPTGLIGLVVSRIRGVPLVVYSHGRDARDWPRRPAPVRWIIGQVARRAARVVANSDDTAMRLRGLGVAAEVVSPGVDLDRFRPSPRPSDRRVLYLGGRTPGKGYEIASRIAHTLAGPSLREVAIDEVPSLIAEHDLVLVPSEAEAFGLVAVEAIASGRWVVATDVGGLRDVVIDGVNGSLVADGDFAGAVARVPDYDPAVIAHTVERFSLARWQAEMSRIWDEIAPEDR